MTSNLSLLFKKYTVPTIFTLLGLVMVVMGIQSSQNSVYIIATIMMFVAGALSFLYSSGLVGGKILSILGFVALAGAIVSMFLSLNSVADTVEHGKNYEKCISISKLNLEDIRSAQKAYAEVNSKYAADWNELIDFIENGKVPVVKEKGTVPSRALRLPEIKYLYNDGRAADDVMSEYEAWRLSQWAECDPELRDFRRDTVLESFKKLKFTSRNYRENREKTGAGAFSADSLPFIPMSGGQKWTMEVKDSIMLEDGPAPAIRVGGTLPFARIQGTQKQEMYFGSTTTATTEASWEK